MQLRLQVLVIIQKLSSLSQELAKPGVNLTFGINQAKLCGCAPTYLRNKQGLRTLGHTKITRTQMNTGSGKAVGFDVQQESEHSCTGHY